MMLLTFVVGHVADRFDRRRIGLVCQMIEALTSVALAIAVWQYWVTPVVILSAVAILGAATAFERPTMAALLPNVVGPALLQKAVATSTSMMQTR